MSIRCLPKDIIAEFEIDLTLLKEFGDKIKVGDLDVPETVEVLSSLDETIAAVSEPREEEVEAPVATETPEGEEGAEGAEGETPAEGEAKEDGAPAKGGEENKE